ncbi:MAG: glycine--tRNA ligase subunit beta, partial [Anaerolineae bacterium]
GRTTRGIRPGGSRLIPLDSVAAYEPELAREGILLDVAEREAAITGAARALAASAGGSLGGDAALLREVANLVESPLPILGSFDSAYLRLPDAVLLAVMHKHQRYFPVLREGRLLPHFVAVANGAQLDVEAVRKGNEEVLAARYADAAFFYAADTRLPFGELSAQLGTLTFQEKLGSVLDKVQRLTLLVPEVCELLKMSEIESANAGRAAALCKNDLGTQLVVEFTSLQGIMGRHYALLSGEPEPVARAIEEHYLPRFVGDRLPEESEGTAVGLADRLDTLVGLFAVGIRPTGAADPWGLRRAALGVVQILVEKCVSLSLAQAISAASEQLPMSVEPEVLRDVEEFVIRRLEGYLREAGYRYDLVQSVLAEQGDDPSAAREALDAMGPWLERSDWDTILDNYARCVRITRDMTTIHSVDLALIDEPATRDLYDAYLRVASSVREAPVIETLMQSLAALAPLIARFFDDVLVMAEDLKVRQNRLALLQSIGALADGIIDLSQMEGF